jgi:hypothetical protein
MTQRIAALTPTLIFIEALVVAHARIELHRAARVQTLHTRRLMQVRTDVGELWDRIGD